MPTIDELRLARATAIAWDLFCLLYEHSPSSIDRKTPESWWQELSPGARSGYIRTARAIEPADAALGVVSVPVECTVQIMKAFWRAGPYPEHAFMEGWSAMLAASPFAPEPEEKG